MKSRMLVQRVTRTIGDAIHGQHYGQIFFWHWHCTMLIAVDDGDWRAPVALAAHAPVAQAPGGFLLAQAQVGQRSSHRVYGFHKGQSTEHIGVHCHTALLVAVPVLPLGMVVGQPIDMHDLVDREVVFFGEGEVTLVVGGNAHDGAVAVAHQHIVAHPHID